MHGIDAGDYGLLANIHFYDIDTPLKAFVQAHPHLADYCERLHSTGDARRVGSTREKGALSMLTITAVIRAKAGREDVVERALRAVIAAVRANEPGTVAYVVSRDRDDPTVFTTFERFRDEAAMTLHNESQAVADFVAATKDSLSAPIVLQSCQELDAKLR